MAADANTPDPWTTPALEPLTDPAATSDRNAMMRNGIPASVSATT